MRRPHAIPHRLADRRLVLRALAGLAAAASAPLAAGAQSTKAVPAGPDLSRGVNLSHWFAQSTDGYDPQRLARFVTSTDIARIAGAGFSHVRLGLEPDAIFVQTGAPALVEPVIQRLRAAIKMINSHRLGIVLDMHPVGASKDRYLSPEGADRLVANWQLLARRLIHLPPDQLALEILNEPEPLKGDAWWALQERIVTAIRAIDPVRTLIVNAGGWSGADDLVTRTPYRQEGLVYTFHHYAPLLFTHQGATWTWDVAQRVHDLPWPIEPAQADAASDAALSSPSDRAILRDQIVRGQFTQAFIQAQFDQLAAWSRQHGNLQIYAGEFGAYRPGPREARLRWLAASRQAIAGHGWGWALWDNSVDFGLVTADRRLDPETLKALGVTPP